MTAYSNLSKEQLIAEIKRLKKGKKFGLLWEDKPEDVAELCKTKLPVLVDVEDKEISDGSYEPTNILIEGDNYHALSVLNYTHKGRIDVIYIDPPYNTGAKDWKYNNNYVDINDSYRHSKWLSMMSKRLRLAKNLLKHDGVLICAIDDNELAALNLLLDEIFPSKIKNTVVIVNNPHGVSRSGFSRCHEYALFMLNQNQIVNKKAAPEDIRTINLRRSGNNSLREDSPTMFYPILIDKKKLKIIGVGNVPEKSFHPKKQTIEKDKFYEIWPIDAKGIEKNWYYSKKRVMENGHKELECKIIKGQVHVFFHHSNNSEQTYKSFWTGSEYDAGAYGATVVKNLINKNFPFPKSINTVLDCLRAVIKSKEAIVLDFFAGSGTTGHAVLLLNKEDEGKRSFILCTNNENNIADDICYPRIKKVIEGHKDYPESTGIPAKLKYFRTDFVDADPTDKNKKRLTEMATEMLCLKEGTFEKVTNKKAFKIYKNTNHYTGIIFDQMAIPDFKEAIAKMKGKFSVYVFSLGDDSFEDEFNDIQQKVELSPIPEVILRVYRRIFK